MLYAKERFRISDAAYHGLSMLFPVLPRTCQVKQWEIFSDARREHWYAAVSSEAAYGVKHLLHVSPMNATFRSSELIRIKLTGDGTNIGKLHVVAFGFTIPEDQNQPPGIIHFASLRIQKTMSNLRLASVIF